MNNLKERFIMWYIVMLFVGVIIGVAVSMVVYHSIPTQGTLKVDISDPDGPFLFLELNREDMDVIYRQDRVALKVDVDFSHK
jgi:hypothetical protein